MDDEELIKQFIRTERGEDGVVITVSEIEWPTPDWPVSHWTFVSRLPLDASEAQVDRAVRSVLSGSRFFWRVCDVPGTQSQRLDARRYSVPKLLWSRLLIRGHYAASRVPTVRKGRSVVG